MKSRVEKYNYNEKSKWRSGLYSTGLVVTSVFLLAGVNQLHNQGVSAQTTDTTQPSADNTSATVWMPDATLREKFAEAAGVSADTMTKADVAKVKSLKITDGVITSLEGLQYATGLESLTVIGSGRQSNGEQDYINDSQDSSAPYQYSSDSGTTDISSILKSNDYSYLG